MSNLPPNNMPTLGDDDRPSFNRGYPTQVPPLPPLPPRRPQREGISTPVWILLAVSVGFMLPFCACGVLFFASSVTFFQLADQLEEQAYVDTSDEDGVGIIRLEGPIYQGEGLAAASETVIRDIDWMEDNENVKAIVVMANSPGGDANASDVIWNRLAEVDKPVLVAVDGLCASGCYYIAMGATPDEIYATPNSLIGSIGVVSTFFNIEELADEIGVEVNVIATGENKDFGSLFRDITPEEEAYWREQLAVIFDNFINRVVGGRANHLTEAEIRELANGRVWASSEAQNLGLIDGILYPEDVLERAADLGGLNPNNFRQIESPYTPTFLDLLFSESPGFSTEIELPDANDMNNMLQQSPIQYRYYGPYSGIQE